ncbi:MAG: hypothetical protein LUG52_09975 [Clostridia bacterium]|nr:hypothetical protein [Clostridia bacterium]
MKRAKELLSFLIAVVMCAGFMPGGYAITAFAADTDTTWYNDTKTSFTLYDAADLAGLASLVNAGNNFDGKMIVLGNSIDLNSEAWTPIGTNSTPFKGTFDGQGSTVQNLSVSGFTYAGFFGYADGSAVIKNVTITGSVSGTRYAGGIVGYIASGVTVENCTNTGTVANSGTSCRTGGVVGFIYGTVSNCTNTGTVASDSSGGLTGGVVGYNRGKVSNCSNTGNVSNSSSGAYYTGGVVGHSNSGTVSNCYNKGGC